MLILSLDCAGSGCGVCVWQNGRILADTYERMERGQDQRLMPLVLDVMGRASVDFSQLDRIAVTRGPGSFTGLRIGLATARGLGLASDKPVIGIDRFSIYREAFKASGKEQLVVIESRRKELYCRTYSVSGEAGAPTMLMSEDILDSLKDKDCLVSGDVAAEQFAGFQKMDEAEHITSAKLAAAANANDPAFLPRPLYLRAPDVTMPKNRNVGCGVDALLHPLTVNLAPQLAALHSQSFGKAAWSLKQFQSSLALDTTRGWGVFDGDKLLAFILCQLIPDQSEVLALCVEPAYRRQGAGERLLRAAADAAKQAGSNLYLEVAADNVAALSLYEKAGFVRTGHRPRYYRIGTATVDAVLYTLPISKG